MRLLVEYTSHGRGPAAPQTYTTTLDIVDDVAERLLKAKTPYTFRERKRCTREALICIPDLRHRESAGTELRRQRPDFEHPAG